MCRALHIECFNLQPIAATEVAARLCWYSCLFPLVFEFGLFTSDCLQGGIAVMVLASVSVGVRIQVYSSSADKTTSYLICDFYFSFVAEFCLVE